jgi:peptide/nickel transport system ATP-binding protein
MVQNEPLLKITDLKVQLDTYRGVVKAIDGIDLEIGKGEIVGLVGESGSGKSMTALSILRLIPSSGRFLQGDILFHQENLLAKSDAEIRKIRGNKIAMIFQEPMTSLNPSYTVGNQIGEVIRLHQGLGKQKTKEKIRNIIEKVRLPDPDKIVKSYPHELSGGMQQRIMIAMALSCEPDLLIADEPTTALDVTIQAQVLTLLNDLRKELSTSVLLITHNLGVVAWLCSKVAVMYAGKIMEFGDIKTVFKQSRHPYYQALLASMPRIDREKEALVAIEGDVPNLIYPPPGCKFHPRCHLAKEICMKEEPAYREIEYGHWVSCWMA